MLTSHLQVGAQYGSSKHAKLVVVQIHSYDFAELNDVLAKIKADILADIRQKKSVVTLSFGMGQIAGVVREG